MRQTVRNFPISTAGRQGRRLLEQVEDGMREAGRLWTDVVRFHAEARAAGGAWPNKSRLHEFTRGGYALHSQTVQQVYHKLLGNVEATMTRRREDPSTRRWLKLPHHDKDSYPLVWPAQAVHHDAARGRVVLPMGRGRKSLCVPAPDLAGAVIGGASISGAAGHYTLHLSVMSADPAPPPGDGRGTMDLGLIHHSACVTDAGEGMLVSGRGIRAVKRHRGKRMRALTRKQKRCEKGSRRWEELQRAKNVLAARSRRRIKDLRHKATTMAVRWFADHGVGTVFVGDPRGARHRDSGRKHNRRMSEWEVGEDLRLLKEKFERAGILCFSGDERGTSSRCPECGRRHKPRGRLWRCPDPACGFAGHRDVVGAVNMHEPAFGQKPTFPPRQAVTYPQPGPVRKGRPARGISPDTGHGGSRRRVASQPLGAGAATPSRGRGRSDPPPVTSQA